MLVRPIPDLQRFRNQCTGIGHTREASERTGAWRSRRVIDCAPPEQRKFAVGYPQPISDAPCVGVGLGTLR
jgi:hypothetical protein